MPRQRPKPPAAPLLGARTGSLGDALAGPLEGALDAANRLRYGVSERDRSQMIGTLPGSPGYGPEGERYTSSYLFARQNPALAQFLGGPANAISDAMYGTDFADAAARGRAAGAGQRQSELSGGPSLDDAIRQAQAQRAAEVTGVPSSIVQPPQRDDQPLTFGSGVEVDLPDVDLVDDPNIENQETNLITGNRQVNAQAPTFPTAPTRGRSGPSAETRAARAAGMGEQGVDRQAVLDNIYNDRIAEILGIQDPKFGLPGQTVRANRASRIGARATNQQRIVAGQAPVGSGAQIPARPAPAAPAPANPVRTPPAPTRAGGPPKATPATPVRTFPTGPTKPTQPLPGQPTAPATGAPTAPTPNPVRGGTPFRGGRLDID